MFNLSTLIPSAGHFRAGWLLCVALAAGSAGVPIGAAEISAEKPIVLVGQEIEVVLDVRKKEVRFLRLALKRDMPTGALESHLMKPYTIQLTSSSKLIAGKIATFKASDRADGIGTDVTININVSKSGEASGIVNMTSQYEETTLYHSAQQLEVKQK